MMGKRELKLPVANRYSLDRSLKLARRAVYLTQLVIALVSIPVASFLFGWPGFWAAIFGTIFGTIIITVTCVINKLASCKPELVFGLIMGGYLFKVGLTLFGVWLCYDLTWCHQKTLFLVVLISFVTTGFVETKVLLKRSVLIVDPPVGKA